MLTHKDPNIVVFIEPVRPRLRERRVEPCIEETAAEARRLGRWRFHVQNGGSVANAYRYPADTEVALVIAAPDGRVAMGYGRTRANNVTQRSAALGVLARLPHQHPSLEAADYFDLRVRDDARNREARDALRCLWREAWREPHVCLRCAARPR